MYRFFTMVEMIASDVPGSWRFLLYVSALCGCSNIYRCYWLPRWLRCFSVVYQLIILTIYTIIVVVALAAHRSSHSLSTAFENNAILSIYLIIIMLNILILWQTFRGSGVPALFKTWGAFQVGNSYTVKNKIWRSAVIVIVGLITISSGLIFIGISTFHTVEERANVVATLFPGLGGQNMRDVILWMHIIIRILTLVFCYSYLSLCCVVVIDITFLIRTLREKLDDVFFGIIVDDVALKRCVDCVNGIWELVGAANGAFGASLGMCLLWTLPNIINVGFQLVERKEFLLYLPSFATGVGVLILILVPSAILAAQVKHLHLLLDVTIT